MEPTIRKLTIQTYKAQVALRDRMIDAWAKEFERENQSLEQKAGIARQLDNVLKEKHAFQLMLELLERKEREENTRGAGATSSAV